MTMESKEPKREKKNLKLKKESKDKLCAIAIMLKWLNLQITKKNPTKGNGLLISFSMYIITLFFPPQLT